MSIIEETLNRLSEERAKTGPSQGLGSPQSNATLKSDPVDKLPGDDFNALPWSAGQARAQKGKMSRLPVYVVFFAVAVSALAWFGIHLLERSGVQGEAKPALVAELVPQPVVVKPQATVSSAAEAPPVAAKEIPVDASVAPGSTTASETPPPAVPSEPTALKENESVATTAVAVSAAKPSETAPPAAPVAPAPAVKPVLGESAPQPISTPTVAASKPSTATKLEAEKQPLAVPVVAPAATASATSNVSTTGSNASPPSWVSEGRRLMEAKDPGAAFKVWNQGFESLSVQQRIVAVAAFYDQAAAIAALKKLDDFPNAMVVAGSYAGRSAWYLLLHSGPETQKSDLARAMSLTGIRGGAVTGVGRIAQVVPVQDAASRSDAKPPVSNVDTRETAPPAGGVTKAISTPEPDKGIKQVKEEPASAARKDGTSQASRKVGRESSDSPREAGDGAAPVINVLFESQIEQIAKAFTGGRYREAEELARTVLDQNPSSPAAYLWVGKSVLARGQFDEAERHLARATELSPNLAEAWTLRGISAQESGNHAQALKYFGESLRAQPNQAEAYFNMGYSNDALGNRNEAEGNWRRFLEIAKDKPRYAKQRSYVEQHLGAVAPQE